MKVEPRAKKPDALNVLLTLANRPIRVVDFPTDDDVCLGKSSTTVPCGKVSARSFLFPFPGLINITDREMFVKNISTGSHS
jgi:hypothetical protein